MDRETTRFIAPGWLLCVLGCALVLTFPLAVLLNLGLDGAGLTACGVVSTLSFTAMIGQHPVVEAIGAAFARQKT